MLNYQGCLLSITLRMSENTENKKPENSVQKNDLKSLFKTVILFVAIVVFLRASVVEAYKIPSGSMLPTLQIGDHILVTKFNFGFRLPLMQETLFSYQQPKRGDIVVFTRPDEPLEGNESLLELVLIHASRMTGISRTNIIKRVIGLPGDVIEVNNGQVLVNGNPLIEPYAVWVDGGTGYYGPYKIPENNVLLLGDNRDQSKDSRFWDNPYLDMKLIKGKALIVYFNFADLKRIGDIIR